MIKLTINGLDITVDGGAVIEDIFDYKVGDST